MTTQAYFPDEPRNASDGIYRKACPMAIVDAPDGSDKGHLHLRGRVGAGHQGAAAASSWARRASESDTGAWHA